MGESYQRFGGIYFFHVQGRRCVLIQAIARRDRQFPLAVKTLHLSRMTPGQLPNGGRLGANVYRKNGPDVFICFDRVGCYPMVLHYQNTKDGR